MAARRDVPFITGLVAIGLAVWLVLGGLSWLRSFFAAVLIMFGWAALKTAFQASDREIDELTGARPMSEDTAERFKDRL